MLVKGATECHHITITKQNQTKTVRTFMAYIVPAAVICDNGRDHSGHGFSQWKATLQQPASHNLIQYWPRHMTLYAIIMQQCFKVAFIIDSTLGHISLRSLLGRLSRYPLIQTVHCFYEYTTWERVALAWHEWADSRLIVPKMATRPNAPLSQVVVVPAGNYGDNWGW